MKKSLRRINPASKRLARAVWMRGVTEGLVVSGNRCCTSWRESEWRAGPRHRICDEHRIERSRQ